VPWESTGGDCEHCVNNEADKDAGNGGDWGGQERRCQVARVVTLAVPAIADGRLGATADALGARISCAACGVGRLHGVTATAQGRRFGPTLLSRGDCLIGMLQLV
jgi:hypothetical protein